MTFYKILWLIILVCILGLQVELLPHTSPVIDLRTLTLRQVVPVSFRTTLGLFQMCYKCHTKHIHPHNTLVSKDIHYVKPQSIPKYYTSTPRPSPSMNARFRRIYDADTAHVDLESYGTGFKTESHQKSKPKYQNVKPDSNDNRKIKILQHMQIISDNNEAKTVIDKGNGSQELTGTVEPNHGKGMNVEGKHESEKVNDNTFIKDSEVKSIENKFSANETVFGAFENKTAINVHDSDDEEEENYKSFKSSLDEFDCKLLATNFRKFTSMPASRGDNGMSFVQSGLFLGMVLMVLSTEVDTDTKSEIFQTLRLNVSDQVKIDLVKRVVSSLPESSAELRFRWASRLVVRAGRRLSEGLAAGAGEGAAAAALRLSVDRFEGTETPEAMATALNKMIETDSGGSIRDTFEADDLTQNEEAVLISTVYFRARWRSSPTLLNGTRPFQESGADPRSVRMIRINDLMNYVDIPEWDAEALEISYSTEGLSLLMVIPRGNSINSLVAHVTNASISALTDRMQSIRIAAVLPLYTLRMTLLLPNKLQAMGISRLVDATRSDVEDSLRISQAVQRIMFWAEAGRNAFKDDGLEWDEPPKMQMTVDRPYMFFVRWQNMTLMNGNFVL